MLRAHAAAVWRHGYAGLALVLPARIAGFSGDVAGGSFAFGAGSRQRRRAARFWHAGSRVAGGCPRFPVQLSSR